MYLHVDCFANCFAGPPLNHKENKFEGRKLGKDESYVLYRIAKLLFLLAGLYLK